MGEETQEITAPKVVIFIAMLFMLVEAVAYFTIGGIGILYGILVLLFIAVIFISLALVSLGPVKIPYYWWIMLIIGILLILFEFLENAFMPYFTGILVISAVIVELVTEKKDFKASKLMALVGIAFSIWDCITIFLNTAATDIMIVNAVFGLILAIVLLILVLDLVDIKIPYTWWVFLTIAFVIWYWVSPNATGFAFTGFGGTLLMIAWVLILFAF